jgi:hypothetical protein
MNYLGRHVVRAKNQAALDHVHGVGKIGSVLLVAAGIVSVVMLNAFVSDRRYGMDVVWIIVGISRMAGDTPMDPVEVVADVNRCSLS